MEAIKKQIEYSFKKVLLFGGTNLKGETYFSSIQKKTLKKN
jgi:hypothetical protein